MKKIILSVILLLLLILLIQLFLGYLLPLWRVVWLLNAKIPDWVDVQLIRVDGSARRGVPLEGVRDIVIHYVGNPTLDEVRAFQNATPVCPESFRSENGLDGRPIIAILAGSRRQEISDNLLRMMEAAEPYAGTHQLVLAAAPGIDDDFYKRCTKGKSIAMLRGKTFQLLSVSEAALVTSGTATLETALFRVPQVVCYYMKAGVLASLARRVVLKIPYISLVNLVAGKEVVPELVAHQMTVRNVRSHLGTILPGGTQRQVQLDGYSLVAERLGNAGAPGNAARLMLACLGKKP